jgi:glycosyltransferase involved in cell wall biosynthesis
MLARLRKFDIQAPILAGEGWPQCVHGNAIPYGVPRPKGIGCNSMAVWSSDVSCILWPLKGKGEMKLSVVIPAYNEKETIREIVARVHAVPIEKEIVIVDDGSTDGTREILADLDGKNGIRVFLQPVNRGKGAAIARGFQESRGDIVVIQDADLEYDPAEYPKLVHPIESGNADVVYGSRFLGGGERRVLYFWHTVGNRILTLISNMLTNLNLTDMETCYKVFRREVVRSITIESPRFGLEPEITAKIARRGYRVYEVPISYYGRTYEEGKKIGFKDAVSAIWTMLKFRFREVEDPRNVGHVTLARMAKLDGYNRWLHDFYARHLGHRILEIGSGFGNMTKFFADRERVIASDLDPVACETLRAAYRDSPGVTVESLRFPLKAEERSRLEDEKLDTAICLNVLEHIEEDREALRDIRAVLQPGGTLILLVPALPRLYGSLDQALHHFRRYAKDELAEKLKEAGFLLEEMRFLNRPGVLGWYLNSRILRRKVLPRGQLKAVNLLMPFLRREVAHPPSVGMSLLAIARS